MAPYCNGHDITDFGYVGHVFLSRPFNDALQFILEKALADNPEAFGNLTSQAFVTLLRPRSDAGAALYVQPVDGEIHKNCFVPSSLAKVLPWQPDTERD
jgi:hypothetical protein